MLVGYGAVLIMLPMMGIIGYMRHICDTEYTNNSKMCDYDYYKRQKCEKKCLLCRHFWNCKERHKKMLCDKFERFKECQYTLDGDIDEIVEECEFFECGECLKTKRDDCILEDNN